MEIREYDYSYELLNTHLFKNGNNGLDDNIIYEFKRKAPKILLKPNLMENSCFNFNDNILNEHTVKFVKHTIQHICYDNNYPWTINVNYQPFGTTYYHALTEVLPNALWLINNLDKNISNKITILVPESKFIENIFKWFEIINPIYLCNKTNLNLNLNFIKQRYTECGNPSPEKINLIRDIVNKKVIFEKKYGIFIYRRETQRNIINSDEVFTMIKNKYSNLEWKLFDSETFENTVELFSKASIIIGPHGAGLTNMLFSPDNITVIEFIPETEPNLCYWHLSELLNNNHYIIPIDFCNQNRQLYINCNHIINILP
jgi:capsular polysaccharide biosynthesis protein